MARTLAVQHLAQMRSLSANHFSEIFLTDSAFLQFWLNHHTRMHCQAVVHCHVVANTMTVIVSWFCLYFWLNYVNSPKSIAFYKYIYYLCNREKTTKE